MQTVFTGYPVMMGGNRTDAIANPCSPSPLAGAFEIPLDPNFDRDELKLRLLNHYGLAENGSAYYVGTRLSSAIYVDLVVKTELHCAGARLDSTAWISVNARTLEVFRDSIGALARELRVRDKHPLEILRQMRRGRHNSMKRIVMKAADWISSNFVLSLDQKWRDLIDSSRTRLETRKRELDELMPGSTQGTPSAEKRLRELEEVYTPKITVSVLGLALIETPTIELQMLEDPPRGDIVSSLILEPVTGHFEPDSPSSAEYDTPSLR